MLLFFTSPIGLGHASRDIAIASYLHNDIIFTSGMAASKLLSGNAFQVLDLYRPAEFIVKNGQLQGNSGWLVKYYQYYKECKNIARSLVKKYPDSTIISDEDFASIAIGEEVSKSRVLITDVTKTHFTSGPMSFIEKYMNKKMQKMIDRCNCVIIPDTGNSRDNLYYVGPIVRNIKMSRSDLRKKFGFNKKTIILNAGASYDYGNFLVEKTVNVFNRIKNKLDIDMVIVSDLYSNSDPNPTITPESGIKFMPFNPSLHEYIFASDLVISLAGRSTMDESIVYGIPGIFIPIKNHFEQEQGAMRLGYRFEDIDRIEELIELKLNEGIKPLSTVDGAVSAARLIREVVNSL